MKLLQVAALASVACLGACSGGGSGGGGSGGGGTVITPTPSPIPSPSPSASPTPSYTSYDALAGDRTFLTACAGLMLNGAPPPPLPATGFGDGFLIRYTAASQTYQLQGDGLMLSFGPGDTDAAAPAGVLAYVKPDPLGGSTRFSISRPGAGGVPMEFARHATIGARRVTGSPATYVCVLGVPTLASDAPPVATYSFPRVVVGATAYLTPGITTYSLARTTSTFSVDLATLQVSVTMQLIGTPAGTGGAELVLGTLTGTGTLNPDTGGFVGLWTSTPAGRINGNFGGRFFGPQGREFGYAFSLIGQTDAGSMFSAQGTSFGSR